MPSSNLLHVDVHDVLAASATSTKVAIVKFDIDGDVNLVLSSPSGIAKFRVTSSILCHNSPVFRTMLGVDSRFRERTASAARTSTSEPLELTLQDDDPRALDVILRIIYLQYDCVPPSLDEDQLYTIAILCDKYDMRQSLGLWVEKWLSPLIDSPTKPVSGDKWMFIAYAFARKELFSRLTKEMILNCKIDNDGSLLTDTGTVVSEHIPQRIVAEISARRRQAFKAMIDCLHSVIDEYRTPNSPKCTLKKDACDDLAFGFLLHKFSSLGIYPDPASILPQAIQDLNALLDTIRFHSNVLLQEGSQLAYSCGCGKVHPQNAYCGSCGSYANNLAPAKTHPDTCSPILHYKDKIKKLVDTIEGLKYDDFVRIDTTTEGRTGAPCPGANFWDCLRYM